MLTQTKLRAASDSYVGEVLQHDWPFSYEKLGKANESDGEFWKEQDTAYVKLTVKIVDIGKSSEKDHVQTYKVGDVVLVDLYRPLLFDDKFVKFDEHSVHALVV